jgi:hypothetical protein
MVIATRCVARAVPRVLDRGHAVHGYTTLSQARQRSAFMQEGEDVVKLERAGAARDRRISRAARHSVALI